MNVYEPHEGATEATQVKLSENLKIKVAVERYMKSVPLCVAFVTSIIFPIFIVLPDMTQLVVHLLFADTKPNFVSQVVALELDCATHVFDDHV